jgi:hypothetical protein
MMEQIGKELNQEINLIILENKSLIIIKLKQPMIFLEILNQKKCRKFSKHYNFYENSNIIKPHQVLTEGTHQVRMYSKLVGGTNNIMIKFSSSILT